MFAIEHLFRRTPSVSVTITASFCARNLRIQRRRSINAHQIFLRRSPEFATRDFDLELGLLLLPDQQIGSQVDHPPLQIRLEERPHRFGFQVEDGFEFPVTDERVAAWTSNEIIVQDRGQRYDVLDYDVFFSIAFTTCAARVCRAREDACETDFVLLGHVTLGLFVFHMADEKMDTEGSVEGISEGISGSVMNQRLLRTRHNAHLRTLT